jgi:hypothetical protein
MERRRVYLMILLIIASVCSTTSASASDEGLFDLKELTSSFDDPQMNSYDLAFYLATHGFNAVPDSGHVELSQSGSIYILTPNGEKPGLCDIELKN